VETIAALQLKVLVPVGKREGDSVLQLPQIPSVRRVRVLAEHVFAGNSRGPYVGTYEAKLGACFILPGSHEIVETEQVFFYQELTSSDSGWITIPLKTVRTSHLMARVLLRDYVREVETVVSFQLQLE